MRIICLLILSLIIFTACKNNVQPEELKTPSSPSANSKVSPSSTATSQTNSKSQPSFPSKVDLVFKPLQLDQLKEEQPRKEWVLSKEIPFGEIKQQKVVLDIYKDANNGNNFSSNIHGMIRFKNSFYNLQDELMEIPTVENSSLFLLNQQFSDQFILLGGVELFSNGPGLNAYIAYDVLNDKWFTFENWGKPQIVDLDSDGEKELVIQFEGLHLNFPDLSIYTWSKGIFKECGSIKSAVMGENVQGYATIGTNKKITVSTVQQDEQAIYTYDNGKLLRE